MNLTELMALVNAGFTKDDIIRMAGSETNRGEVKEVESNTKTISDNSIRDNSNELLQTLVDKVRKLENTSRQINDRVNSFNVHTDNYPVKDQETFEGVMAEIINPKNREVK